jgi:hypothetical protein
MDEKWTKDLGRRLDSLELGFAGRSSSVNSDPPVSEYATGGWTAYKFSAA